LSRNSRRALGQTGIYSGPIASQLIETVSVEPPVFLIAMSKVVAVTFETATVTWSPDAAEAITAVASTIGAALKAVGKVTPVTRTFEPDPTEPMVYAPACWRTLVGVYVVVPSTAQLVASPPCRR
jgi:hypothetical protein